MLDLLLLLNFTETVQNLTEQVNKSQSTCLLLVQRVGTVGVLPAVATLLAVWGLRLGPSGPMSGRVLQLLLNSMRIGSCTEQPYFFWREGSKWPPSNQSRLVVGNLFKVTTGASHDVGCYESEFANRGVLLEWANQSFLARDEADADLFRIGVCNPNERVFHGKGTSTEDFFYVYTYLFRRMFVRIPFTRFQAAVLKRMNVARSQLHPNGWACIQAFLVVCSTLGLSPSLSVFFHYFHVRPIAKRGWVSLTSIQEGLFKAYSESFKDFKTKFFKIIIKEGGRNQFRDSEGEPLFLYYWTEKSARIDIVPTKKMTPADVEAVKAIDDLPLRLPARGLVNCLCHEDCINMAFGTTLAFAHTCRMAWSCLTSYFFCRCNVFSSSSQDEVRPPARTSKVVGDVKEAPSVRLTFKIIHPTPTGIPLADPSASGTKTAGQATVPVVIVAKPSEVAVVASGSTPADASRHSKKKKRSKEKDQSPSKRSKRDSPPRPLPGGPMDPTFGVSDQIDFRMNSAQRAVVEHLPERELIKAALEHTSRGAMLMWYAERFADRRGLKEIQRALVAETKSAADAKAALEELTLEHSKCELEQAGLKKKLQDACVEVATLTTKLQDLSLKYDAEKEETVRQGETIRQAKEKIKSQEDEVVELHAENIRLQGELQKAAEENVRLNQEALLCSPRPSCDALS